MANLETLNSAFIESINGSLKATNNIVDQFQKATAYASIANAIASTGLLKADGNSGVSVAEGKESLKSKAKVKQENTPVKTEETAPVIETPTAQAESTVTAIAPAEVVEPILDDAWTEENMLQLKDELDFVRLKNEQYGEEQINNCINSFSQGVYKTTDDINPLNIRGFVAYIQDLESQMAAAAS